MKIEGSSNAGDPENKSGPRAPLVAAELPWGGWFLPYYSLKFCAFSAEALPTILMYYFFNKQFEKCPDVNNVT